MIKAYFTAGLFNINAGAWLGHVACIFVLRRKLNTVAECKKTFLGRARAKFLQDTFRAWQLFDYQCFIKQPISRSKMGRFGARNGLYCKPKWLVWDINRFCTAEWNRLCPKIMLIGRILQKASSAISYGYAAWTAWVWPERECRFFSRTLCKECPSQPPCRGWRPALRARLSGGCGRAFRGRWCKPSRFWA